MPESTNEQLTAELETLRTTNAELVAKNATRKAKIAELEATNAKANDTIRQVTIDGPLKQMAESISTCPELWLEQFSKSYRLEMVEGKLTVFSAVDSKPVQGVPFERIALAKHLTTGDDATAKAFRAISIVSRASGGQAMHQSPQAPSKPKMSFGLR